MRVNLVNSPSLQHFDSIDVGSFCYRDDNLSPQNQHFDWKSQTEHEVMSTRVRFGLRLFLWLMFIICVVVAAIQYRNDSNVTTWIALGVAFLALVFPEIRNVYLEADATKQAEPNIEIRPRDVTPDSGPSDGIGWAFRVDAILINHSNRLATVMEVEAALQSGAEEIILSHVHGRQLPIVLAADGGSSEVRLVTGKLNVKRNEPPVLLRLQVRTLEKDLPFTKIIPPT